MMRRVGGGAGARVRRLVPLLAWAPGYDRTWLRTDPDAPKHKGISLLIVDANAPGITLSPMWTIIGERTNDMFFDNVRVPDSNMILGAGRGFEVVQGRLGPGRIHHAMRSIGSAEKALDLFIAHLNDPRKKAFGKQLSEHGVQLERVAKSRIEIDAARLQVLNAAIMIDTKDAKFALKEIAEAKVLVPDVLLKVIDRAIQAYGAAGVSQDTPLSASWAGIRTLRLADGPDEVHNRAIARIEYARHQPA